MSAREGYSSTSHSDEHADLTDQMIWYDTLDLPEGATVQSEVLPTIETAPVDDAYSHKAQDSARISPNMARGGIIAMELFGPPRAKRPWRPK